ncbi:MAG TPA: hypothetical protein VHZ09_11935 [Acidobacteriaceae bacterium]|nr:hypothetical protein [Acidobacteriaceae bacterium]
MTRDIDDNPSTLVVASFERKRMFAHSAPVEAIAKRTPLMSSLMLPMGGHGRIERGAH